MIKRALISVSDKTGIVDLAKALAGWGVEIISTGGTAKALSDAGVGVVNVSDITRFPECLDGRVKTLHPKIHGGLLAIRDNAEHMKQLKELGIEPIDMVVINLYPFKKAVLKEHVELEEAIENIDIGGPTMLRAAAKNYQDVVAIVDPSDYQRVLEELKDSGAVSLQTKFKLAYKVFEHTSHYDTLISNYLKSKLGETFFPETLSLTFEKAQEMRYGENPHQKAVFYREVGAGRGLLTSARQLNGKELSYNNINDTNGAIELLKEFEEPTVVAVKHANPCGVASGKDIYEAYVRTYEADPVSIFGGILAANREIDRKTAEEINKIFVEIVVAPSYSEEALKILCQKSNLRVLQLDGIADPIPAGTYDMKKVAGGLLVQDYNTQLVNMGELRYVTEAKPDSRQMEDLIFAMKVVKHTKSNAIVIAKDKQTLGVGPGQTNRIMAAKIAIEYGGERTEGAVLASDAFFPFSDCVEAAAAAGIKAIIQPGGSIKDKDSVEACNKYGIAMVFTGIRHFKH
ncbi:MAG: bifunctional phosphoribosylaminoimidazolecarboxamide formyltransferase/IMP cyclohydrolase [Clostridiales bacterium]|jgi:phosphoribosylaminoimidazolecarboxamide formyltransferase/IMP cyclohydrolase|nr:bifunctional phosphoribosylaminoimidazolecarboxamide formyltransferase/IMP cyclohydrolase [Eubacteriales bacterium]MDH7565559.1 bifunctional phosphoribosylaminoimidazolecarboxamide formyltransferase/IMP cyclohydrolase [Clostridiales bacterium]